MSNIEISRMLLVHAQQVADNRIMADNQKRYDALMEADKKEKEQAVK